MSTTARIAAVSAILFAVTAANATEPTEAWRASGFALPESVSWDGEREVFYVSNIAGSPMEADGNGFISRLGADGAVLDLKWVEGLDAPKGTDVAGGKLYVSDLTQLVEIDTASGEITGRYPAEGAVFLNDVVVAPDGRVFVADTFGNAIFVLDGGAMSAWVKDDPGLIGPNGLTVVDGALVVSELGDASQGFENLKPGTVKAIDLATKEVTVFGTPDAIGGLDGIEPTGDGGVTVIDNPGGRLLEVQPGSAAVEIFAPGSGAADHEFVPNLGLLIIPNLQQGTVVAYNTAP
jgi:hypothetical protein